MLGIQTGVHILVQQVLYHLDHHHHTSTLAGTLVGSLGFGLLSFFKCVVYSRYLSLVTPEFSKDCHLFRRMLLHLVVAFAVQKH